MGMYLGRVDLSRKVRKIAEDVWNVDFDLDIKISSRMTRALATYCTVCNRVTGEIVHRYLKFSTYLINGSYKEESIDSAIKHELAHWQVSLRTSHFHDGDYEFEQELKRIGAFSTGEIKNAGNLYQCICSKCGKVVVNKHNAKSAMKYAQPKYSSRCCHAPLKYIGCNFIEDINVAPVPKDTKLRETAMKSVPSNVTKIEDIINGNKMNKTVMLNALRQALDEKSQDKIDLLRKHYPEVFEGTLRYVPQKLKSVMGL